MNPDASPNAPNAPRPDPVRPAPAGGGFASVLKVAVPLVVLVGVVFGITYITMYAPKKAETDPDAPATPGAPSADEPPLRFFTSIRRWDPPRLEGGYRELPLLAPSALKSEAETAGQAFPYSLQDRTFQGVYEPSAEIDRTTQFWFENRNPKGVTLELKRVGCTSCTSGRLAVVPPELTRELLQYTAVGALPTGPVGVLKFGLIPAAAKLEKVKWDQRSFENYYREPVVFKLPAAADADGWSPQWGVLELRYHAMKDWSDKPLSADFAAQVEGSPDFALAQFGIFFHIAAPCAASPATIDAGRFEAGSGERRFEFVVHSATRGPDSEFGDLERPSYKIEGPAGYDPAPFVEVLDDKTVRVPEAELPDLQNSLHQRVRSAYKFTVAVRPKVGERRMDIGRFERTIALTAGGVTQQVKVTAVVRGPVWLDGDRNEVTLPGFGRRGLTKSPIDLSTERPGLELALLKDECSPKKLAYELQKQPDRGGQGHYKLFVTVPPGTFGTLRGEVVLEVKGPNPQKMRIPVTGSGTFGP
jgi:hypothetical protein